VRTITPKLEPSRELFLVEGKSAASTIRQAMNRFVPEIPYSLQATPIDRRYNNSRDKGEPVPLEPPIKLVR